MQTLSDRKASWHKSCRDLFSNTKLKRATKRKLDEKETKRTKKQQQKKALISAPLKVGDLAIRCVYQKTIASFVIKQITLEISTLLLHLKLIRK